MIYIYPGDCNCTTDLELAVKEQFPQLFGFPVEDSVPYCSRELPYLKTATCLATLVPFSAPIIATTALLFNSR